jgi:hypothetical protein
LELGDERVEEGVVGDGLNDGGPAVVLLRWRRWDVDWDCTIGGGGVGLGIDVHGRSRGQGDAAILGVVILGLEGSSSSDLLLKLSMLGLLVTEALLEEF